VANIIIDINTTIIAPVITVEEVVSNVEVNLESTNISAEIDVNSPVINATIDVETQVRKVTINVEQGGVGISSLAFMIHQAEQMQLNQIEFVKSINNNWA
jgi:hypothetical protein